ncbi:hypothetical protein GCM10010915_18390 [Microbacterium faecale]|uniref:DUF349 domain-containing protein n=1 Tax=Microbacterium faecale TaxID=1804630 RepID=A0A916YBU4_9MICO|nr:DUF349 domain-containing protein [Microbacterium faecale]GGD37857.1 hypothetical protein GCM10010915_18390 [Microbacterium faecale]
MSTSDNTAVPDNTTGFDATAASEQPPATEQPATTEQTTASDKTVGTEDVAAPGASAGSDQTATPDETVASDETAAGDETAAAAEAEKPAETGEAAPADKPAETGEAAPADKPAETGEAAPADERAETDTAAEADKPAETDTGAATDASPAASEAAGTDAPDKAPSPTPTPSPTPKPGPVPSPAALAKRPKPPAPAGAPDVPAVVPPTFPAIPGASEWGRVDEKGVVSVREGDDWRVVGEYPDGTHDEALQYYVRKFDELAFKVNAIEQRHQAGGASASALRSQAGQLKKDIVGAPAVGDLAALEARLTTMIDELAEAATQEAAAQREVVDAAIAERTTIVEKVEQLAARDPQNVQWKQATTELNDLFTAWQDHQKTGPRLPKSTAQALWKRFRDSRSKIERARRAFFAELDEVHKAAKAEKTQIVERAEALASRGEDGIPTYRALLDDWKRAGRAGRKADDALWARFKAAGDVLYGARADRNAEEEAESKPRIEAREALLEEAAKVADIADLKRARQVLTEIQRRWEDVGRVFPRDVERGLDGRMRKIELALKDREDVDWKRNNPETKARANDMEAQLREALEGYEKDLERAKASGDERAIKQAQEAIDARTAWLRAIGG